MSWFNTYKSDGDGLTRKVVTKVDLTRVPLADWTDDELGFRLAVIYPEVDGYEHLSASDAVKTEVSSLMAEIERRGYDATSNLRYNEQNTGRGWLSGFRRKTV